MTYSGQPQELSGIVAELAERLRALEARFLGIGPQGPIGPAGSNVGAAWQGLGSYVVPPSLSPVASVTFPIPPGFRNLVLYSKARTSAAVTSQAQGVQFNADTGANYYWQTLAAGNATVAAGGSAGQTTMRAGLVTGANATAGLFGGGRLDIMGVSDSEYKTALSGSGAPTTLLGTGQQYEASYGIWKGIVPLTTMKILPAAGGYVTDSAFYLYGLTG